MKCWSSVMILEGDKHSAEFNNPENYFKNLSSNRSFHSESNGRSWSCKLLRRFDRSVQILGSLTRKMSNMGQLVDCWSGLEQLLRSGYCPCHPMKKILVQLSNPVVSSRKLWIKFEKLELSWKTWINLENMKQVEKFESSRKLKSSQAILESSRAFKTFHSRCISYYLIRKSWFKFFQFEKHQSKTWIKSEKWNQVENPESRRES